MTLPKLLPFLFLIILTNPVFSQIDKEFWFVGPEASASHGDKPLYIRISTMDEPANITLRMPANNKFVPVKNLIPQNSTFSIQLDIIDGNQTWLDSIENRPADSVLNKGLLLTSDKYVTAYYEINNASNPAIFPLKGKNGVGLEFYIPGQTNFANHINNGSEAFDIVATRDTTIVTITPSIDIVGHPANVPFQIILNKGETYSARTLITTAEASLAGSHIVASKPVAITISDDSIVTGGWDIIGDQIIPINLLGWEYIAIKGYADNNPPNNNDERVYITAVENNTEIRIDGDPVPVTVLNTGEQYNHGISNTTNTALIRSTNPVYVYHLTGHPGEAGASILPQDSCTGSRTVGFNRSTASALAMMILTRNGNQDFFLLNNSNTIITAAGFNPVPGTGGNWVYYRQNNMTIGQVPLGANLLKNTNGKFHLGILNNVGASSEYGYFSDFSTLYLGADASMCPGDSVVLDGGPFRTSYEWKKLISGNWTTVGTNQTFVCQDSGFYACITNGDFCTLMDSIHVIYYPNASVSLGADQSICQGTSTTLSPGIFQSYTWSNGATSPAFSTGNEGPVWVTVVNNDGCVASDTVLINVDSLPLANHAISGPAVVCQGASNITYAVESLLYTTSYQWTLPPEVTGSSDTNFISLVFSNSTNSGTITVEGVNGCGVGPSVTFPLQVNPIPAAAGMISAPDTVCQGQTGISISVPPVLNATSYQWQLPVGFSITGGSNNSLVISAGIDADPGTITVKGVNACGDGSSSSVQIGVNLFPQPAGIISGISPVCQGKTAVNYSVNTIPGADSYIWTIPAGANITAGNGTPLITVDFDSTALSGAITVKGRSNQCGDGQPATFPLMVNPLPAPAGVISGSLAVCQAQTGVAYSIQPLPNASNYIWTIPPGASITGGSGTNQILVSYGGNAASGIVQTQGYNGTCGYGKAKSVTVTVNPLPQPTGQITGPNPVCQGDQQSAYSVTTIDPLTTSYLWTINPTGAATVSGTSPNVNLAWNESYSGQPSLTVKGLNACGSGPLSPPLIVRVNYHNDVVFTACNDLSTTKNARPLILKGGLPMGPGGVYSGPGVMHTVDGGWIFDPANGAINGSPAGTNYTIAFRYTNTFNCYSEATQTIKVFSSNASQTCPGTMTDVREGKIYPTFLAGSGTSARCWMASNLNFGIAARWDRPQTENCQREKYCPGNLESSCDLYGGYYQWGEMMNYTSAPRAQGICPPGWHIPILQEWTDLRNNYLGPGISGTALKDTSTVYGFHGLLNGILYLNNQWFFGMGGNKGTMYWSSSVRMGLPVAFGLNSYNPSVSEYSSSPGNSFAVRCVKDP